MDNFILLPKLLPYTPIFISLLTSLILIAQSLITIRWMINIWSDPNKLKSKILKKKFLKSYYSFTAIIPAKHESKVIGHTLRSVANINYPKKLKKIIVVCSDDDKQTIAAVIKAKNGIKKANIKIVIYNNKPINKPHALNEALKKVKTDVVTIFDAEDEPSKDIYNIINSQMKKEKIDVIQSGVQLMNINTHWFSTPNVLEYYLWFKSALSFFYQNKVTPLGGNTVFIKTTLLKKLKGWDQEKLTEDADLGLNLSLIKTKVKTIYDPLFVTKEETPSSVKGFIKQRTRWHQGFLQILFEGKWLKLPSFKQKLLAGYILSSPLIFTLNSQSLVCLYPYWNIFTFPKTSRFNIYDKFYAS